MIAAVAESVDGRWLRVNGEYPLYPIDVADTPMCDVADGAHLVDALLDYTLANHAAFAKDITRDKCVKVCQLWLTNTGAAPIIVCVSHATEQTRFYDDRVHV